MNSTQRCDESPPDRALIISDDRVADVLRRWPEAYEVFCRHGCPDMRRGFFGMMARIMRLRWAARVHGIPIAELLRELNACAQAPPDGTTPRPAPSQYARE